MRDRRGSKRVPIGIAVKKWLSGHQPMAFHGASKMRTVLCQAGNISRDGIGLMEVFEGWYPMLPKCWLEFSLPDSTTPIAVRGDVRWQAHRKRYHLTAVHFSTIAPAHRRLIGRYITATEGLGSEALEPWHG